MSVVVEINDDVVFYTEIIILKGQLGIIQGKLDDLFSFLNYHLFSDTLMVSYQKIKRVEEYIHIIMIE